MAEFRLRCCRVVERIPAVLGRLVLDRLVRLLARVHCRVVPVKLVDRARSMPDPVVRIRVGRDRQVWDRTVRADSIPKIWARVRAVEFRSADLT